VLQRIGPPAKELAYGRRAGGERTFGRVALEATLFAALVIVITYASEQDLLKESFNYLRRRPSPAPAAT